ncbi:hypothetical protein FEM48_Zijuj03G0013500 [Ziziphus jujuba var. spinosa]|uniref:Uncharacterized protein n=1 Tax=Ziziphus jujuba var. spinosa TaxID=714518 RepID=A0A978VMB8_ZIZJJ|nr:hypothetical protein FEM48_Zijuj03G0013500 [Ziziphus jujuba var. spinosa]
MASLFSFCICIPLLYTIYYVFTNIFSSKLKNLPPSPLPLPLIAQLHLLKKPIHRTLSKLSEQYGLVYLLRFGFWPIVVVSSPSAVEECLVKNDAILANRPRLMIGKCLGSNFTSLPWIPYGDLWRNVRRILSLELLSNLSLQNLAGIRSDEAKLLLQRLMNDQGQVVDMKVAFFELSLNNMMRMMAGKRYYGDNIEDVKEVKRFREIQVETFELSGKSNMEDIFPFMRWTGASKGLEKSMMELHTKRDEFMQSLIDEHKVRMENERDESNSNSEDKRKTMVEVLLSLQENDPENYRDDIIKGLMLVRFLSSLATSICIHYFFFFFSLWFLIDN